MLDIGLYVFYVLLFIAVAAAMIFPLMNSIKEPKALIRTGIGVAAILVLFGISYGLSDSDVEPKCYCIWPHGIYR